MSKVSDMDFMFNEAKSFNRDIGQWDVSNVTDMSYKFSDTKLSTENYNKLLIGWATRSLSNNVKLDAGTSKYSIGAAAEAKEHIINNFGWTITDGGVDPTNYVAEINISNLLVYPNPFTNHIQVESGPNISGIKLFNIAGQIVAVGETVAEINVGHLKEGIYFLHIEFFNHPPQIVKLIKNK